MKKEVLTSDWQQQWGVEWGCIVGLRNQKEHVWSCSGRRPPSAWSFAVQNKLLPKFRVRFAEKRREYNRCEAPEPERPTFWGTRAACWREAQGLDLPKGAGGIQFYKYRSCAKPFYKHVTNTSYLILRATPGRGDHFIPI